jgi:hypothetical protein
MKTPPNIHAWAAALMLAAAPSSHGQSAASELPLGIPAVPEHFDLKLTGATVGELVDVVQASTKSHLNILVPADYVGMSVPDLDLRGVTFKQVARMLAYATQNSEQLLMFEEVEGGWVFQTRPGRGRTTEKVRSWVIQDLLESYELDDILALLQTTLEMDGKGASARSMQLHKETGALLGTFDDRNAELVEQLLTQLRQNRARSMSPTLEKLRQLLDAIEREQAEAEAQLAEALDRRAMMGVEIAELKIKGDAGQVARLGARVEALQVEAEILKQKVQQLQKQRFDLRMRLKTGIDMESGRMDVYSAPQSSTGGR